MSRPSLLSIALAVALAIVLNGCGLVGPDYRRPELPAPPAWSAAASAAAQGVASPAIDGSFDGRRWWTVFGDPLLDALVDEATAQSLDLQVATLRIASARAQLASSEGKALPSATGNALAGRSRMSPNGLAGALGGGGSGGSAGAAPAPVSNLFQVGFDASWELDLWGGVRRNIEAAQADRDAAEEGRREALVSLSAEIVRSYLALRGSERQLAIAQADIAAQQRLRELTESRQRSGLSGLADVAAQSAQLLNARSQLAPIEQDLALARNRLALLLALPPGALDARLQLAAPAIALPPAVPVGLPGELLQRRPDVRRSEAELRAASARIGVAQARLFPSITLGLSAGLQASRLADLHDWSSRFALGGALLNVPIFQGGQLRSQLEQARIEAQRAALAYQQAVLASFHDADDALIRYGRGQQRSAALARAVDESRHSRDLAQDRWRNGLAPFIEVLAAERQAHQAELQLVQSVLTAQTDLVALFKALGGGWEAQR